MDFAYGPIDTPEPTGLEPLDFDEDDEGFLDEDDGAFCFDGGYDDEDDFEEPGLASWDDLRPFGSFDDGFGWDEGF